MQNVSQLQVHTAGNTFYHSSETQNHFLQKAGLCSGKSAHSERWALWFRPVRELRCTKISALQGHCVQMCLFLLEYYLIDRNHMFSTRKLLFTE